MWRYIAAGGVIVLSTKARAAAIGDGALPTQIGHDLHALLTRADGADRHLRLATGRCGHLRQLTSPCFISVTYETVARRLAVQGVPALILFHESFRIAGALKRIHETIAG
ncbi:hypothetical protein [Acrocarpospora sp. B8E8]|uniref:hypothetical protein n=1 Tax=Acrocarpospora sp. B8E8 TaxID=3153572 RepID=UPI00325C5C71